MTIIYLLLQATVWYVKAAVSAKSGNEMPGYFFSMVLTPKG